MKKTNLKILIRNLAIELLVYSILLIAYFFVVLQYLGDFLTELFRDQLTLYAFLGLGLIVVQAVFLETVTSYLIRLLRLDRLG
jgi:hypothetical protein